MGLVAYWITGKTSSSFLVQTGADISGPNCSNRFAPRPSTSRTSITVAFFGKYLNPWAPATAQKNETSPRQKPKHIHAATDPLVNPGNPPHCHQTRSKAYSTGTHHRMVTLAQSSPSCRSARPLQINKATVMLGRELYKFRVLADGRFGTLYGLKSDITPCPKSAATNAEDRMVDGCAKERVNDLARRLSASFGRRKVRLLGR
jgi:hypothetical protein